MFKKVITGLSFFALTFVFLLAPIDVSLAEEPSKFVPCEGSECSFCDLVKMANFIIIWLFGVLFLIFAIIMFSAGFGLVTSAGNQVALDAAKKKFQNALIGIVIIMAAWLLIDTLMKGLLKDGSIEGWGPWSKVECILNAEAKKWEGDPETDPTAPAHGTADAPKGAVPANCSGTSCKPLDPSMCKTSKSCSVSPDLADAITKFHKDAGVDGARVTEGMPPTRPHKSACHQNGTCIDYSKPGGMSADEVVRTINAAKANNLRPVYEVKTEAEKTALVNAGAPAGNIKVLGNWIDAPHFSIYGY